MNYSLSRHMSLAWFFVFCICAGFASAQEVGSLTRGVVRIEVETSQGKQRKGTGFIAYLAPGNAYILTSAHVIEDAQDITVEFFTRRNRPIAAAIIGQETAIPHGLAVLLVKDDSPAGVKALEINRLIDVYAGDPVETIGFPAAGSPWSISRGEVTGRKAKSIIFSGAVDSGSSGGPLIKQGEVIGIISETYEKFAYAVPAVIAQYVLEGWGVPDAYQAAQVRALIAESLAIQRRLRKADPRDERYAWADLKILKSSVELRKLQLLLAVEAMRRSPTDEAQTALRTALGYFHRPSMQIPSGVGFSISADWRLLANARGGIARIWDLATGKETKRFLHEAAVTVLAFSPDGRYLATGTDTGTSHVWDIASGHEVISMKQEDRVNSIAFSLDGQLLVTTGRNREGNYFHVWNLAEGQIRWTSPEGLRWEAILLSPKGDFLAARNSRSTYPGRVWVWEMTTGQQVWQKEFLKSVKRVAFSRDGQRLAVAVKPEEQSISGIWSLSDGRELVRWFGSSYLPVFSQEDKYFAMASGGRVLVWDLAKTTQRRLIPGDEVSSLLHIGGIDEIVFSPDNQYIATESGGFVSIWELATGAEIGQIPDAGSINNMAFSPDGQYFISDARREGKVEVRQLWPEDLLAEACQRLDRNMTPAEWRQYVGNEPYQRTCENIH